jgi:acyl dehydratase
MELRTQDAGARISETGELMQAGDTLSWTRTFTEEDIRQFAMLSGDEGEHHLVPDEQGRVMAQEWYQSGSVAISMGRTS